ncbi:MAG: bacteriohopanetetrol glucosamine biosynthesis glycosyltransferase HpnI [Bryobacterales bacterium]|nr:bacteriohopanetetrol glucosamine biosynthesis glycosyltransferase HpnI [Bryobacterales bacterium]
MLRFLLPAAFVAGSCVYCLLSIVAARRYRAVTASSAAQRLPLSILKPLHGLDEGLEENLRSYFAQDYAGQDGQPAFEILCAARDHMDPALRLVEQLRRQFPAIPCQVIVTGDPPYANAKVHSLACMLRKARYDLLVMADSDVRVEPGFLDNVSAEFQDPKLGIATCPYRAIPGDSPWSFLEAIHMNTEFLGGVLTARMLEGVRFALGPTIVARREVIAAIGGFEFLKDFLAEDFVMGNRAAALGYGVILSSAIIEHRIGSQPLLANLRHRLRWARSTRRSRPAGYFGEIFLRPLALAILLVGLAPWAWPALPLVLALRIWQAEEMRRTVRARFETAHWLALPVQDLLSFALWAAGFFGNSIRWRDRRYRLLRDGRFEYLD